MTLSIGRQSGFRYSKILKNLQRSDWTIEISVAAKIQEDGSADFKLICVIIKKICCCEFHICLQGHQLGVCPDSIARYL